MKLILPIEMADAIKPKLPKNICPIWADSKGNLDSDATDAEVYFTVPYLEEAALHRVLKASPSIRWLHTSSAGVDRLLTPIFLERDIILTNSAGIYAIPIAEFVLAFILNHAKQLPSLQVLRSQHLWSWDCQDFNYQELMDKTLLVIGAGGIGQAIGIRASAFGMRVWGVRRHPKPLPGFERVVGADELYSLLSDADYIAIATPLTPETKGMINADVLRSMRPSAYLINIARGAVVDEAALVVALKENWIAGAALDTFSTEPLPADNPFWSLSNVFITPHCSSISPRNIHRILELFFDNLNRYRSGLLLKNIVNKQASY